MSYDRTIIVNPLNIKGHDNRGTSDFPYGFVYIGETRVGFAGDGVFITREAPASDQQLTAVRAYLDAAIPGWNSDPA